MQLHIRHKLPKDLVLPIHYQHILQSIIYRHVREEYGFSNFLHQKGYQTDDRQFRMFVFGFLNGKYEIEDKQITFHNEVSFQVRSTDARMLLILKESLEKNGIDYLGQHYDNLEMRLSDDTMDKNSIKIRMLSPICVYSTDSETKKTTFYNPMDLDFEERINSNFRRKYKAYTGIEPSSDIRLSPLMVTTRDKVVTLYKNFYISGWLGEYELSGEPKYLDFLYQTGLGGKNSQGFGMFEVM